MVAEGAKLAVLVSFSGEGGVERMLINLMRGFLQLGVEVDLLRIRADGPFADMVPGGARVIDLPSGHALTNIPAIARYLRRNRPEALLAVKDRSGRAAIIAKALSGVSTRLAVRLGTNLSAALADKPRMIRLLRVLPCRMLYPRADAIVAVSGGVARDTAGYARLPAERIAVVPNPVITSELEAMAEKDPGHPWLGDGGPPVLVGAGRLTEQKDFAVLLRALAGLREFPGARLILLGEGRERGKLDGLARELGIRDRVDLPGFVANPYAYLRRADLFVLSSRWEGSPNVLTEALALGTPVVATDCPSGPREILRDGELGPLVPVGDEAALAEGIRSALAEAPDPERLRRGVESYEQEESARRYLEVLFSESPRSPFPVHG
jgi:glycosyltransferase involved in cell wall biosynthesis